MIYRFAFKQYIVINKKIRFLPHAHTLTLSIAI